MLDVLDVSMTISTPSGPLEVASAPYDLHPDTDAERAVSWRKKEVTNPHVEGSYTIHAERENVVVPVTIWVEHPQRRQMRLALERLEAALSQLHYRITYRVEDDTAVWDCEVADYSVQTQQAYLHAGMALVAAQIPRRPAVVYS